MSGESGSSWKNAKSQSRNARQKKAKFKDKSKIVNKQQVTEEKKTRPKLQSNAYRYDSDKEDEDVVVKDTSRDYGVLSKASTTSGYFQFKNEKALFDEKEPLPTNMFQLDIKLLSLHLSTIPFHILHKIDEKYLTKDEMDKYILSASLKQKEYQQYVKEKLEILNKMNDMKREDSNKEKLDECQEMNGMNREDSNKEKPDERQEIIAITIREDKTVPSVNGIIDKDKEELENYLDDILDD